MYYLDLFSGIGGFALGAYWAGWRFNEHYFSEVDDYCVGIYNQRFIGCTALGDIKEIRCDALPKGEWFVTGGFPCQEQYDGSKQQCHHKVECLHTQVGSPGQDEQSQDSHGGDGNESGIPDVDIITL